MNRGRVLIGVAAAAMLTLLVVWGIRWSGDGADHQGALDIESIATTQIHARAEPPNPSSLGAPHGQFDTHDAMVGGTLVSPDEGPLTLGAIDLWCADGRLGARARLDENGSFLAGACPTTTCVRLRHPAFDQPIAWELGPAERGEFEVAAAPGISGIVRSPLGEVVANASLVVRSDDGRRAHARTDAGGEFAVALPGLRPCDACDLERLTDTCSETTLGLGLLRAQLLVSAPEFAPTEFDVELERGADASSEFVLDPSATPITGVVRGADQELFDSRTKILATNVERADEQHHAQVVDGHFSLVGLAEARYRLRAVRDGRELGVLDSVGPGEAVEITAREPARGLPLRLLILDASARPAAGVRVDGGPFVGGVTDHEGRLEAPDVALGSHALRLRAAGCSVVRAVVEVTPDPTVPHRTVRLPQSCDPQ